MTLQEASIVKQRMGVEAPQTHHGARQWLQHWRRRRGRRLQRFPAMEPLNEKDLDGKASAQTDAKHEPTALVFQTLVSGFAKSGVHFSASVFRPRLQRLV